MRFGLLIALLACVGLQGCSDVKVPLAKSTTGRAPQVADVPDPEETVRGADEPPIVTLEIPSQLRERRLSRVEELPGNIIIPNTNLNAVPVTAALQAILAGTDVSLSWEAGSFDSRLVTVANLSGPLPQVVDKICASAKIFCGYRRGLLEMREKETFIIELPSVPTKGATSAAKNTMADTISDLAGSDVKIDQQGGNLLYTTDTEGYEHVKEYLAQLRQGRPLVVMQLYIWEVTLTNDKGAGINWSNFTLDKFGGNKQTAVLNAVTGFSSLAAPGVSLGATLAGRVDATGVFKFLSTQGQVQTISNPQLTFISGSNAEFRVGGKQRYISQVGTASSVSSSTTTSTSNNTVSTDSLDTGLTVNINGAFESGVITAMLELSLQDVISLNQTTTESGVTVDLPETSERKVTTSLRVRPGDNLVLAGLVTSRDTNNRDKVPLPFGANLTTSTKDELKNTELVILVKPSIVKFADAVDSGKEDKPVGKSSALSSPQDAVMIDKDGSQVIKLPSSQQAAVEASSSYRPELMQPHPVKENVAAIPIAQEDDALVDKRLLQRGFSHAFNELQEPTTQSFAYGGKP